eukprot:363790-Chlamydomonas_euryale.AAC.6
MPSKREAVEGHAREYRLPPQHTWTMQFSICIHQLSDSVEDGEMAPLEPRSSLIMVITSAAAIPVKQPAAVRSLPACDMHAGRTKWDSAEVRRRGGVV